MDKIIGKTLAEMVVPEDDLWHIYGSLPHAYDVWRHTFSNFSDNPDIFAGLSNGKRSDAVQASLFDAMMAEIMDERNAEKAKVRNRRRSNRKHNILPKVRKQMRDDRGWNRYLSMPCYGCKNIGIAEYRIINAESADRADWELEEEENWIEKRDAEYRAAIEAEMKEWQEQLERERAILRKQQERYWNGLNEWLQYA